MITTRRARPEDVQEVVELANLVFRPASSGLNPSMGLQYPLFLSKRNAHDLFIAEDDGKIIALNGILKNTAVINGHKISIASMGAVCTHPDYRGQGIATRLLHEVLTSLHDEGVALLVISGDRGLYTRNGADFTSLKKRFTLTRGACDTDRVQAYGELPGMLSVTYYGKAITLVAEKFGELYQREPVRYLRPKWQVPILIKAAPGVNDVPYPPRLRAAASWVGECLSAYVLGSVKDNKFRVMEYAGDPVTVGILLQKMLTDSGITTVTVDVPIHDFQLTAYLEACGHKGEAEQYPFTFIITNTAVLWSQIQPILQERAKAICPNARLEVGLNDSPPGESKSDSQRNRRSGIEHESCPKSDMDQTRYEAPIDLNDGKALLHFVFDVENREQYGEPWDPILPLPLPWPGGLNFI